MFVQNHLVLQFSILFKDVRSKRMRMFDLTYVINRGWAIWPKFFCEKMAILRILVISALSSISIKGPRLTDRDCLKDTNNAGYQHPIKTLYCRIRRFYSLKCDQFGQWNSRIPHFSNYHDLSVNGPLIHIPLSHYAKDFGPDTR
jgi:hypothetical protein